MKSVFTRNKTAPALTALAAAVVFGAPTVASAAWEPTRPVEWIIPAGSGGGADQMARFVQGVVVKHDLMKQPLVIVNKSGGAGAEGFLYVKNAKNDPHKLIITLSNLFTTPMATGIPFNWKDITPVAMLALDQFMLWTAADAGYGSAGEYIEAAKEAGPGKMRMGGTGSKQEDQIITVALQKQTGAQFTYVPYKGGGEVATQVVGGHVDSSVNNPIEGVSQWRAGNYTPHCVFDSERSVHTDPVTEDGTAWSDIPTCQEEGIDVTYQMLRGIFTSPGVDQEVVDYYVDVFKKVTETEDWKKFMATGAFDPRFMTGDEFAEWVADAEEMHRDLMEEAGFLAK